MPALIVRAAGTIRRSRLLEPGDRVAVAVSGGSDSVALAWLLREVAPDVGATVVGLIHVNHRLRGGDADADEAFCRALATRLSLPIEVGHCDVAALAKARRISLEAAARAARYERLSAAATRLNANLVATGHTEDDQAETVLLRLLRGAGTRGLSGIRVRRDEFIRPLLDIRRAELQHYLRSLGETWREDASNADRTILRNRIRHELVPVLQDIAPGGVRALARLARLASDDEAFLTEAANEKRAILVLSGGGAGSGPAVDAGVLGQLPAPLARRIVRQLASETAPEVSLSARHLEAVYRLAATDKPGGRADLPGLVVQKRAGRLVFSRALIRRGRRPDVSWAPRELEVPGSVDVPELGVTIAASLVPPGTKGRKPETPAGHAVVMKAASVTLPLFVRSRRPGDRIQPLGAPGRRKLQDVFVDRKVPQSERDTVPVVTDAAGEIVWVAGVVLAERCRIGPSEDGMLLLELRKHR